MQLIWEVTDKCNSNANDMLEILWQYVLQYTVGYSLESLIMSHFFMTMGFMWLALLGYETKQRFYMIKKRRSALECGWPYSKCSFGEIYYQIKHKKSCLTALVRRRLKTQFPTILDDMLSKWKLLNTWIRPGNVTTTDDKLPMKPRGRVQWTAVKLTLNCMSVTQV